MKRKSYINYPTYFNRLWVPEFDDDGNLIINKGLQEFVDTGKQFDQREKKKMDDGEDPVPKYEKPANENEMRMSSLISYISKRIKNA